MSDAEPTYTALDALKLVVAQSNSTVWLTITAVQYIKGDGDPANLAGWITEQLLLPDTTYSDGSPVTAAPLLKAAEDDP